MKDELKEILESLKPQDEEFTKVGIKEYPLVLSVKEQKILLDYITNLQEENTKKDNIINGIEEFIEYLDRETNVYLVNTAYIVILGKLKKLKIDNGLLQGGKEK